MLIDNLLLRYSCVRWLWNRAPNVWKLCGNGPFSDCVSRYSRISDKRRRKLRINCKAPAYEKPGLRSMFTIRGLFQGIKTTFDRNEMQFLYYAHFVQFQRQVFASEKLDIFHSLI